MSEFKREPESFKLYRNTEASNTRDEAKSEEKRAGLKAKLTLFLTFALGISSVQSAEGKAYSPGANERVAISDVYEHYSITDPPLEKLESGKKAETNIFGSYMEINGGRVDRSTEIEIREVATQLLSQINQNEVQTNGQGKAVFYDNYIKSNQTGGDFDFQKLITRSDGSLEELLRKKKPTLESILRIGVGIAGMTNGRIGQAARVINQNLGIQVGPETQSYEVQQSEDFSIQSKLEVYGQDAKGVADPKIHKEKVVTLPFTITRELTQDYSNSPRNVQQANRQKVVYRLYMPEQMSKILAKDGHGQTKVYFPDDGKNPTAQYWTAMPMGEEFSSQQEAFKRAAEYASIFAQLEYFGKESKTFNEEWTKLKQQELQMQQQQLPKAKQSKENYQGQVIPMDSAMEQQFNKKNKGGYEVVMSSPMQPGQIVMFKGPTKEYRAIVLSSEQNPPDAQGVSTYKIKVKVNSK